MKKIGVSGVVLSLLMAVQAKDYTGDIADGAIAFGEISEDSTIMVASGVTVTSSTPITGSGKLSVSGGGTLRLSAASPSYSGPIDITSSIVAVAAENALGSGKVTINGGTVMATGGNGGAGIGGGDNGGISGNDRLLADFQERGMERKEVAHSVIHDGCQVIILLWSRGSRQRSARR